MKDNKVIKFCQSAALLAVFLYCTNAFSAKPYTTLSHPESNAPDVVEFFSFYCKPCYLFSEHYQVEAGINRVLPTENRMIKYHISNMGKFGRELSEAWAIAVVMGVADRVEQSLFIAVQQRKSIHKLDDIYSVLREVGIDYDAYVKTRESIMVKEFIARQDDIARELSVSSTPSVYVKGRYLINNSKIKADTPEAYAAAYSNLVAELLKK